jgi:hypothetical protein
MMIVQTLTQRLFRDEPTARVTLAVVTVSAGLVAFACVVGSIWLA